MYGFDYSQRGVNVQQDWVVAGLGATACAANGGGWTWPEIAWNFMWRSVVAGSSQCESASRQLPIV
jgi:hypothetical protein